MSYTFACKDGDWDLDDTGKVKLVAGLHKCAQDVAETLLMSYNALLGNGNEVITLDMPMNAARVSLPQIVSFKLAEAIERLMELQRNTDYTTADEAIDYIEDIRIFSGNQLNVYAYVSLVTKSNVKVEKNFEISLRHQTDYDVLKVSADQFVSDLE